MSAEHRGFIARQDVNLLDMPSIAPLSMQVGTRTISITEAETSITIDDVTHVIDSCHVKETRFSPQSSTSVCLDSEAFRSSNILEWPYPAWVWPHIVSFQHGHVCSFFFWGTAIQCIFSKLMIQSSIFPFSTSSCWGFPLFGWARLPPSNVPGGLAAQDQACRYRGNTGEPFVAGSFFVLQVCCLNFQLGN